MSLWRFAPRTALAAIAAIGCSAALAQGIERRRGFSIEITEPKNLDVVLGKTRIAASVHVERPEDVERVEFTVREKIVFVDREPPYETFYDFGDEPRAWVIRAVAYHREGPTASDVVVTRKVDISFVEEVNRVILWATVTDRQGRFRFDLDRDDFRVLENGVPQTVLEFGRERRPVTLAILLDTSGSMREAMKEVHEAARAFVDSLGEEDRAFVITFDDRVLLVQDVTGDKGKLREAIESTEAVGSTVLYDALHASYRKLRAIAGRKAIVLLSDGMDQGSQLSRERIVEEARGSNVLLYAVGIGSGDKKFLKELAEVTGGRAYFADKASELAGIYEQIALELKSQYVLTYATANTVWDGRWIELKVETKDPSLKVRSRAGFPAVRGAGAEAGSTEGSP